MYSVMKGLTDGAIPLQNFWARTAPAIPLLFLINQSINQNALVERHVSRVNHVYTV